jgi:uridine kinase
LFVGIICIWRQNATNSNPAQTCLKSVSVARTPSPRRLAAQSALMDGTGFQSPGEILVQNTPLARKLSRGSSKEPLVVGVAGGTGSGKTTLSREIFRSVKEEHDHCKADSMGSTMIVKNIPDPVCYINHDSYYKDLSHLPFEEREKANFDHPDSLDTELLVEHIKALKRGESVEIPKYDYGTHSRIKGDVEIANSAPIILVEGILILAHPELVPLLDIKIFVDTEDDIRLIRRIQRDTVERKRDLDGIIKQYLKTVRPMHISYVEPSKLAADIIIPYGMNEVALDLVVSRLRHCI